MTNIPTELTYSSVVSSDSICICFLIATLNNLDIQMTDVGNGYLNVLTKEKCYAIEYKECGSYLGKAVKIMSALYGLKSRSSAWHAYLDISLSDMGLFSSVAVPDVWLRASNQANGRPYYKYLIVYVDVSFISEVAKMILEKIKDSYWFSLKYIGERNSYLSADTGSLRG